LFQIDKHLQMTGVCTYTAALYRIVPRSVFKLVGVLKNLSHQSAYCISFTLNGDQRQTHYEVGLYENWKNTPFSVLVKRILEQTSEPLQHVCITTCLL